MSALVRDYRPIFVFIDHLAVFLVKTMVAISKSLSLLGPNAICQRRHSLTYS